MSERHFLGDRLDDVMHLVTSKIISSGDAISPTKGKARELTGVLIELTNPRARLSRTATRGKIFSCLGELLWYLSGSNDLSPIAYYISKYKKYAENGRLWGAYGPRLFSWKNLNQIDNVTNLLQEKRDTRQAVIQLFDATDITEQHKDIPCTCTLQFLVRKNTLHLMTSMRSNDVFIGLPHDIFSFTMLQELVARRLSVNLGSYMHFVGSLHLYNENLDAAKKFLDEGWQSDVAMPPMPEGDPWPAVQRLLEVESAIRAGEQIDRAKVDAMDSYWADLTRLLLIFSARKRAARDEEQRLAAEMVSSTYGVFIS